VVDAQPVERSGVGETQIRQQRAAALVAAVGRGVHDHLPVTDRPGVLHRPVLHQCPQVAQQRLVRGTPGDGHVGVVAVALAACPGPGDQPPVRGVRQPAVARQVEVGVAQLVEHVVEHDVRGPEGLRVGRGDQLEDRPGIGEGGARQPVPGRRR
jgi:hypothetical protein